MEKLPKYAKLGARYAWLIDPISQTLEVLRLKEGEWVIAGFYEQDDKVRAELFAEVEIDLGSLWLQKTTTS